MARASLNLMQDVVLAQLERMLTLRMKEIQDLMTSFEEKF